MNPFKWLLSIAVIVAFEASVVATPCSCIGTATPSQAIKSADRAFVGRVISEKTLSIPLDALEGESSINIEYRQYTLRIQHRFKGRMLPRVVTVTTGMGHGDCGFPFVVGREYVVYARWREQYYNDGPEVKRFLYTDICTRTTDNVAEEKIALQKAR